MEKNLVLAVVVLLFGSISSFMGLYLCLKKNFLSSIKVDQKELIFLPIYITWFALTLLIYFSSEVDTDFIYTLQLSEVLIPWILGGILCCLNLLPTTKKYFNLAIIIAISISVFLLPSDFLVLKGKLPFWLDRLTLIFLWSLIACFYHILNALEGVLGLYNAAISLGLLILFLLGGTPAFYGMSAIALLAINGSYMFLNWPPSKIKLSDNSCKILGFLIGWMICFSSTENLLPCTLILLTLFFAELINALFRKTSSKKKDSQLSQNTTYFQANISGLDTLSVLYALSKIYIVFIIFACFQLYIDNMFSLPIISFALAEWFLGKLRYWDIPEPTFKELNKNLISDLKENFNKIKKDINRDE